MLSIFICFVQDLVINKFNLYYIKQFLNSAALVFKKILQLLKKKFLGSKFKQKYSITKSCFYIIAHLL
jgi:4-coumarate--CoA ligase